MLSFRNASDMLTKRQALPKLSTGSGDLDSLLGGGIELGQFYLFYGDEDSD
jgi:RecA/RadA recombinase